MRKYKLFVTTNWAGAEESEEVELDDEEEIEYYLDSWATEIVAMDAWYEEIDE